jgi:uncharacterized membrane protein HdeD (DUF308 family)
MLAALALGWPLLLMRALFGMTMGLIAFALPGWSPYALLLLFVVFAFGDGILAVLLVAAARPERGLGVLVSEAAIRLGVALIALLFPDAIALMLPYVFGIWAFASGAAALAVARALSEEMKGEWPLPLAGTISIICGLFPFIVPRSFDPRWIIGPYAVLFGFTLFALSMRLRQLAREIAPDL